MSKKTSTQSIFAITTRRPVAITMFTLAALVFGVLASGKLPLNLMPDLSYPSITVRTEFPGSAPEEVENSISKPLEQLLGVINNLESIQSISKPGQSDVILEFNWKTNIDKAIMDVREQLDQFYFEDAKRPMILRYDPTLEPILRFAIYPEKGAEKWTQNQIEEFLTQTRRYADEEIKRKLEIVKGVAAVKIKGGLEEEIRIRISETKLNLLNIDITQITERLRNENVNIAGGNIKEGQTEYIVRTLNEFKNLKEIQNLVIAYKNESPVYLRDISEVVRSHKDREIITRFKGNESIEIEIYKEANANIVDVARRARVRVMGTDAQRGFLKRVQKNPDMIEKAEKDEEKQSLRTRLSGAKDFLAYEFEQQHLNVGVLSDQSTFIKNSIDEVKRTAIIGGFLAVIVLFIFLKDIKSTLIIGLIIPISIIFTFWPMDMFGVSLNLMSLGGLALGVGMLVDNAIVVLESIYRCREEGDDFIESVIRGTKEVGGAVFASTLTTIAVFFPIVFVEGVAGQIFGDLALTVVFSLLASLIAALFLIPMLASRQIKNEELTLFKTDFKSGLRQFKFTESLKSINFAPLGKGLNPKNWSLFSKILFPVALVFKLILFPLYLIYWILKSVLHFIFELIGKLILTVFFLFSTIFKGVRYVLNSLIVPFLLNTVIKLFSYVIDGLQERYPGIIRSSLNNKMAVMTILIVPSVLAFLYLMPRLGSELIPEVHQGEFNVEVTYGIGTPVERTSANLHQIEEEILKLEEVESVSSRAGVDKSATTKAEEGEHTAKITVRLKSVPNIEAFEQLVISKIRAKMQNISGIESKFTRNEMFSFKTPVEVFIKGFDLQGLKDLTHEAMQKMEHIPGLVDLKSNIKKGNPEIHIIYDREKIARYNLNLRSVANLVRNKVLGDVSTKYRDDDRRIDITVLLKDEDKQSISDLSRLVINPGQPTPIRLSSIAKIQIAEGPSEIRRVDQERTAVITANISGERDLASIIGDIDTQLRDVHVGNEFFIEIAGQNKEMEASMNSLIMALILAIFLVYIIMASQFESFVHPFVILFSIPLAFIGVIFILYLLGVPLSIMVYLGMIMLAGIVVNNAIVLVNHINLLRAQGMHKLDAIIEGGRVRLRPILMTTMTTVLGLLPMAIGLGDGAEIRQPMAITVIAGLISSTALTLIVIPTIYAIFDRDNEPMSASNTETLPYSETPQFN